MAGTWIFAAPGPISAGALSRTVVQWGALGAVLWVDGRDAAVWRGFVVSGALGDEGVGASGKIHEPGSLGGRSNQAH